MPRFPKPLGGNHEHEEISLYQRTGFLCYHHNGSCGRLQEGRSYAGADDHADGLGSDICRVSGAHYHYLQDGKGNPGYASGDTFRQAQGRGPGSG